MRFDSVLCLSKPPTRLRTFAMNSDGSEESEREQRPGHPDHVA